MKNPKIEVNLEKRTLNVDGSVMNLDENLLSAGISRVLTDEDENELELRYQKDSIFNLDEECEKVYLTLKDKKLENKLQVYGNESDDLGYPYVSVVGKMEAKVYNR
ncbi:MAG: hypothetical protein ABIB79_05360 [archaeon]